jgi:hypothetical protein
MTKGTYLVAQGLPNHPLVRDVVISIGDEIEWVDGHLYRIKSINPNDKTVMMVHKQKKDLTWNVPICSIPKFHDLLALRDELLHDEQQEEEEEGVSMTRAHSNAIGPDQERQRGSMSSWQISMTTPRRLPAATTSSPTHVSFQTEERHNDDEEDKVCPDDDDDDDAHDCNNEDDEENIHIPNAATYSFSQPPHASAVSTDNSPRMEISRLSSTCLISDEGHRMLQQEEFNFDVATTGAAAAVVASARHSAMSPRPPSA